jgi:hypothetical protein
MQTTDAAHSCTAASPAPGSSATIMRTAATPVAPIAGMVNTGRSSSNRLSWAPAA